MIREQKVRDFIYLFDFDVVPLQETKLCSLTFHLLRSVGGAQINECVVLDSISALGGQLIGWNNKFFEEFSQFSNSFSISVKFKEKATQFTFCAIFMYRPNDRTLKPLFLHDLHITHAWRLSEPWALMGDFNMTRFMGDAKIVKATLMI